MIPIAKQIRSRSDIKSNHSCQYATELELCIIVIIELSNGTGFKSIHCAINPDAASSSNVFNEIDYVFSLNALIV